MIDQVAAGTDPAGVPEKEDEDLQFVFRQLRLSALVFQPAAFRVQHGPLPGQGFLLPAGIVAFQQGIDLCQQDRGIVGLGDEGVAAEENAV